MCNTNPYKELLSRKVPTDFGQGVAMQEWHSAATDPLSSSENAVQNQMGFPKGRGLLALTLRCVN